MFWNAPVTFGMKYNQEVDRFELTAHASYQEEKWLAYPVQFSPDGNGTFPDGVLGQFSREEVEALKNACEEALAIRAN